MDSQDVQAKDEVQVETRYKGVRGWLLLLCVILTIFTPLSTFFNLSYGYGQVSPYFDLYPGLLAVSIIDILLSSGLIIFSFYAGISLWRIKPNAVGTIKSFMLYLLVYSILVFFLPFIAGLSSGDTQIMFESILGNSVRMWVWLAIWYNFINRSKRVKATYEI